ncbi:hypothetical protein BDN67DRAFT_978781 [Paxillus ammoniavirescens]|nr:hypothetical protein BDN67DRAFT_978781 [Paxillus ammoniavirescens]
MSCADIRIQDRGNAPTQWRLVTATSTASRGRNQPQERHSPSTESQCTARRYRPCGDREARFPHPTRTCPLFNRGDDDDHKAKPPRKNYTDGMDEMDVEWTNCSTGFRGTQDTRWMISLVGGHLDNGTISMRRWSSGIQVLPRRTTQLNALPHGLNAVAETGYTTLDMDNRASQGWRNTLDPNVTSELYHWHVFKADVHKGRVSLSQYVAAEVTLSVRRRSNALGKKRKFG